MPSAPGAPSPRRSDHGPVEDIRNWRRRLLLSGFALSAQAQDNGGADPSLVERGHYLATAGDCAACHGDNAAGGLAIESPMGAIYASNISPDPVNGIGKWTLQEFGDALRKGRAPGKGWLYPAMPYTSYAGLSDDDVKALYSYFRLKVAPQAKPAPETKLPFPFMRIAMIGWNFLNLHDGKAAGAIPVEGDQLKRGQELVETLGHCSTCHTPRNDLMGEIDSQHLAGGQVAHGMRRISRRRKTVSATGRMRISRPS